MSGSLFYAASKVGFFLVQPAHLCLLLITTGLALARRQRWRSTGWNLAAGGLVALVVAGFSPLGHALLLPLESRFSRPPIAAIGDVDGIIFLGGFELGRLSSLRGMLTLGDGGERLTETLILARKLPTAKIVFSGGAGAVIGEARIAAPHVHTFLIEAGIPPERILIEDRSRNTRENATLTRDLVRPRAGQRWLLVTSAFHMPRSMGLFRKAGFEVVAWPVDYQSAGRADLSDFSESIEGGLQRTNLATKEYLGLVVYRLMGWIETLWPGP